MYISRGEAASEEKMTVVFRGSEYALSPKAWELWKKGINSFVPVAKSKFSDNFGVLSELSEKGLVSSIENESKDVGLDKYSLLAKSILLFKPQKVVSMANRSEMFVISWLTNASFSLMTEEIVYLIENRVMPTPDLVGVGNKQNLVAKIYPDGKVENNILVHKMSCAKSRDYAVGIILNLMRKGYVVLN